MTRVLLNGGDFDGDRIDVPALAELLDVEGQSYRRQYTQDGEPLEWLDMPMYLWVHPPSKPDPRAVQAHST